MIYIVVNLKREKTKINVTDYDNRSELRQKTKKKGCTPTSALHQSRDDV